MAPAPANVPKLDQNSNVIVKIDQLTPAGNIPKNASEIRIGSGLSDDLHNNKEVSLSKSHSTSDSVGTSGNSGSSGSSVSSSNSGGGNSGGPGTVSAPVPVDNSSSMPVSIVPSVAPVTDTTGSSGGSVISTPIVNTGGSPATIVSPDPVATNPGTGTVIAASPPVVIPSLGTGNNAPTLPVGNTNGETVIVANPAPVVSDNLPVSNPSVIPVVNSPLPVSNPSVEPVINTPLPVVIIPSVEPVVNSSPDPLVKQEIIIDNIVLTDSGKSIMDGTIPAEAAIEPDYAGGKEIFLTITGKFNLSPEINIENMLFTNEPGLIHQSVVDSNPAVRVLLDETILFSAVSASANEIKVKLNSRGIPDLYLKGLHKFTITANNISASTLVKVGEPVPVTKLSPSISSVEIVKDENGNLGYLLVTGQNLMLNPRFSFSQIDGIYASAHQSNILDGAVWETLIHIPHPETFGAGKHRIFYATPFGMAFHDFGN